MSIVGRTSRNHPLYGRDPLDEVDDRATHPIDFAEFADEFGPFTVDVAAAPHNAKCERFYTREQNGLTQSWAGESVWCNPPYSEIAPWIRKAWDEQPHVAQVVMLIPSNRTDQQWWQLMVEPFRDDDSSPLRVRFLPGRLRFILPGRTAVDPGSRPPFGCALLWWVGGTTWPHVYRPDAIPADGLFATSVTPPEACAFQTPCPGDDGYVCRACQTRDTAPGQEPS